MIMKKGAAMNRTKLYRFVLSLLIMILWCYPISKAEETDLLNNSPQSLYLLHETERFINPYRSMTEEQFSQFLNARKLSREKPYYHCQGNIIYFGDRYLSYKPDSPYHGLWQIIWNNNDLSILPICDFRIGSHIETVCDLLIANGIYTTLSDIPILRNHQTESIELSVRGVDERIKTPFQYIWTLDFNDHSLARISFLVTNCWEPSYIGDNYKSVPVSFGMKDDALEGWLFEDSHARFGVVPVDGIIVSLGIAFEWANCEEGTFQWQNQTYHFIPYQHSVWVVEEGERTEVLYRDDAELFREQYGHRQRFGSYGRHLFADTDSCQTLLLRLGYSLYIDGEQIVIERN